MTIPPMPTGTDTPDTQPSPYSAPAPMPTLGRIVRYRLTSADTEAVIRRRRNAVQHLGKHRAAKEGVQLHVGNPAVVGEECAAIIVAVWGPDCVNLRVLLDGTDVLWVTSALRGPEAGQWSWPERR